MLLDFSENLMTFAFIAITLQWIVRNSLASVYIHCPNVFNFSLTALTHPYTCSTIIHLDLFYGIQLVASTAACPVNLHCRLF